jgi:GNAT superfamily N-acetyltransferase
MKLTRRNYSNEEDYWRIRTFLRKIFLLNGRKELSWPAARLDYWRWHVARVVAQRSIESSIFLWETPTEEIAAVLNQESDGDVFLQIHPQYQNSELEETLIETAEDQLYRSQDGEKKRLTIWAHDHDSGRQQILANRGFHKKEDPNWQERQRQRSLEQPLPDFPVAEGYLVRSLGGPEEIPSRSWASWRAFHPNSPDEDYEGWDWYPINIQNQPMYRRDLDLVAIAPDGEVAAFTTLWYDDVTRWGYFEPVGTVPEHQKKGLGKSVIVEAMRRMKIMGGLIVGVGGYSVPANKLYSAVFSEDSLVSAPWIREWQD